MRNPRVTKAPNTASKLVCAKMLFVQQVTCTVVEELLGPLVLPDLAASQSKYAGVNKKRSEKKASMSRRQNEKTAKDNQAPKEDTIPFLCARFNFLRVILYVLILS